MLGKVRCTLVTEIERRAFSSGSKYLEFDSSLNAENFYKADRIRKWAGPLISPKPGMEAWLYKREKIGQLTRAGPLFRFSGHAILSIMVQAGLVYSWSVSSVQTGGNRVRPWSPVS
jgi:hypothetical protein